MSYETFVAGKLSRQPPTGIARVPKLHDSGVRKPDPRRVVQARDAIRMTHTRETRAALTTPVFDFPRWYTDRAVLR